MRLFEYLFAASIAGCLSLAPAAAERFEITSRKGVTVTATAVSTFDQPWAMTFLPDGTALVTTKPGRLFHVTAEGRKREVHGLWPVAYGGQGGLGDVVLHPRFAENRLVYISSVERDEAGTAKGAVVTRARFERTAAGLRLIAPERIWTQEPKVTGSGHFSHRIAFGPDGFLYITSGERQKQRPAQDFAQALGKIIRLKDDGSVPDGNPWQDRGALARSFWSMGHRNMLGLAFDGRGRLWAHEMGPRHGDELNLILPGRNYGWPEVSYGNDYSGAPIPERAEGARFEEPRAYWVPAISPAGLAFYDGALFPDWRGDAFIGGLSSRALVRVEIKGDNAREADRFEWGRRVREVESGPDGALWLLEDRTGGRLLRLTPKG